MPYRDLDGCQHRLAALEGTSPHSYEREFPDWTLRIPEGESDESFHRVVEINRAIREAPEDAIIVWADPGSLLVDPASYRDAVTLAETDGLVLPHTRFLYLGPEASEQILNRWWEPSEVGPADCDEHGPSGGGNAQVFSRRTLGARRRPRRELPGALRWRRHRVRDLLRRVRWRHPPCRR